VRKLALIVVALALAAGGLFVALRPARAEQRRTLYVSGLKVLGKKRVSIVRLTNTSDQAADSFLVHYTIRDAATGDPVSQPGAGLGAQILPGRTLELDLGAIIAQYRLSFDVTSPYSGAVQFVAYGEGGFYHTFGPDVIHVEIEQHEGSAIHDGAAAWFDE